jgi:hypothetical protein
MTTLADLTGCQSNGHRARHLIGLVKDDRTVAFRCAEHECPINIIIPGDVRELEWGRVQGLQPGDTIMIDAKDVLITRLLEPTNGR